MGKLENVEEGVLPQKKKRSIKADSTAAKI